MIVVRTETWSTKTGQIVKAVVRDENGRILGATNQTAEVRPHIVGAK